MSTLGEKVTASIVGAIGKGAESAIKAQHADMKPLFEATIDTYLAIPDLDPDLRRQLETIKSSTSVIDVIMSFLAVAIGSIQSLVALMEPGAELTRHAIWTIKPVRDPMYSELIDAWRKGALTPTELYDRLRRYGFDEITQYAVEAASEKPLSEGVIQDLALRGELSGLLEREPSTTVTLTYPGATQAQSTQVGKKLRAAGFSYDDIPRIKKLFWKIPSVQDLVRMAVREAFTPEIAQRFGQYQDFPPDFATWAAKQGVSAEWAQRYWAAHWDLPSTTQGFEMFHRGIITQEDLQLLLRALDVMPFWREKLVGLSYSVPTRVDIRRMYQLGIVTKDQVNANYVKLGYSPQDAAALTEFTIRYYGPEEETEADTEREWTKTELLDAYSKAIIDETELRTQLQILKYAPEQIDYYIQKQQLKQTQDLKDAYLSRYKTLYTAGIIDWNEVAADLKDLGLVQSEIDALAPLWYMDRITKVAGPTKAELTRFLKKGIITEERYRQELQLMGYADEYIEMYLKDMEE